MNYSALIENRKSVREFQDKKVSAVQLGLIREYHRERAHRLVPEIRTDLVIFGSDAREALEGAAGYNSFFIGAPHYLVLLSEKQELAAENAGYVMQDLLLKLSDMDLGSCWLTFTDSDRIKQALGIVSDLDVAAIAAFGYGAKTVKRLRLNIFSMSNVDVVAKHRYMDPKRKIHEMVFLNKWGNTYKLDDYIGFYDDMLFEALYAASLSPSYLNRQAYGFVLKDNHLYLVRRPDEYNTEFDGKLSLGILMLHFDAVAEKWAGKAKWNFGAAEEDLGLPEGHSVIASRSL